MWRPIRTAPFRRDIQIASINRERHHALQFACRRVAGGWLKAGTQQQIEMMPTHWRDWPAASRMDFIRPAVAN